MSRRRIFFEKFFFKIVAGVSHESGREMFELEVRFDTKLYGKKKSTSLESI